MKKVALMAIGLAVETYGDALAHEQEVLTLLSDIVLDTFAAESAALRAAAADAGGHRDAAVHAAMATVAVHDASLRIEVHARTALAAMRSGAALDSALDTLKNTLTVAPANTIAARRLVADAVTEVADIPSIGNEAMGQWGNGAMGQWGNGAMKWDNEMGNGAIH